MTDPRRDEHPPPDEEDEHPPPDEEEVGGEAACALHRVCEACGALEEGPQVQVQVCGRCGAPRDG